MARRLLGLYACYRLDKEELLGVLYEALVIAELKYKENQGATFRTFAWIVLWRAGITWANKEIEYICRNKLQGESPEDSPAPPLPEETYQTNIQLEINFASLSIRTKKQRRIIEVFLNDPTLKGKEIAQEAGTTPKYANRILRRFRLRGGGRGEKPSSC